MVHQYDFANVAAVAEGEFQRLCTILDIDALGQDTRAARIVCEATDNEIVAEAKAEYQRLCLLLGIADA